MATTTRSRTQKSGTRTDRGPEPAERLLTLAVLVELAALVAALDGVASQGDGR
jgi:hypothetical protein